VKGLFPTLSPVILSVVVLLASAQGGENYRSTADPSVSQDYMRAALTVMLEEVNRAVVDLSLPEQRLLKPEHLKEINMQSPLIAEATGNFGCIQSRLFSYCASVNNRLCYITKIFPNELARQQELSRLKAQYCRAKSLTKTNSAYTLATEWLKLAHVDVEALQIDCEVDIQSWDLGATFVPLYWVRWFPRLDREKNREVGPVAFVELLEPEKELRSLRVTSAKYNKRTRLSVRSSAGTDPYYAAASAILLREANDLCQKLKLPLKRPIEMADTTRIRIEPPSVSDSRGRFGTIYTDTYIFGAYASNKLSYVNRSTRYRGEEKTYFITIAKKYGTTANLTNQGVLAYNLAVQWLISFSVDVKALERDCKVTIEPKILDDGRAIPLFAIEWSRFDPVRKESIVAATVEVLEPDRSLHKLWIEMPQYLNRSPLIEVRSRTSTP
jgi:hypothetical protein